MANQPHPSRKAVTYRLDGALVHRVKAAAAARGETVLALVTRALERELDSPDTVQAPNVAALADRLTKRAETIRPRESREDLDQRNVDDIHEHGWSTGMADTYVACAREVRALLGTDTTPGDRP